MFEQFAVHAYIAMQQRAVLVRFGGQLTQEELSRLLWSPDCAASFNDMLVTGAVAGLLMAIPVYLYVDYATRKGGKHSFAFGRAAVGLLFVYFAVFGVFSFRDPHILSPLNLIFAFAFAGALTSSVNLYVNFRALPSFGVADRCLEKEYLKMRMSHAHQLAHHATWVMILTVTALFGSTILKDYVSVPLVIAKSKEYELYLVAEALRIMTAIIGAYLGVVDQMFLHASRILERFEQLRDSAACAR